MTSAEYCETNLRNPRTKQECILDKSHAQEGHMATPHIGKWRQKSAELLAGKAVLKLYQAEETKL